MHLTVRLALILALILALLAASATGQSYVRGVWVSDPGAALTVTTVTPLPAAAQNNFYHIQLTGAGGTLPYTWMVTSGTLPAGLSLNSDGRISGTPTAAATSTFTVQATDALAVTATKSLSLTVAAAAHYVQLTWAASEYATSYNIKRSTFNGGPYTTIATSSLATIYTDANVTSGITYYYVVSAVNAYGESPNSDQVIASIP